jgi:hypothetical protein
MTMMRMVMMDKGFPPCEIPQLPPSRTTLFVHPLYPGDAVSKTL